MAKVRWIWVRTSSSCKGPIERGNSKNSHRNNQLTGLDDEIPDEGLGARRNQPAQDHLGKTVTDVGRA
jgi:hypothetical protein